jgi:integrase
MVDRVKLTKRYIERELPDQVERETWVWDTEVLGFGIRMRPGSRAAYAIRWKDGQNYSRNRKLTIGAVAQVELEDARAIARQKFGEIVQGENPITKRKNDRQYKHLVSDLIEQAGRDLQEKGRSLTYIRDFTQQMRDYVKPHIGNMLVAEVMPSDIDRLLARVAKRAALHNRVRAGLMRLFTFAVRQRYRLDNPVNGTTAQAEEARTRSLTDRELDAILEAIAQKPGQSGDAMRLLALTGSRPKELFQSRWKDFDLDAGVWTKPAQTVKQKRTHRVTIRPEAVAVLKRIKENNFGAEPGAYVFPSSGATGRLTTLKNYAKAVFAAAGVEDVRVYDLRKAFISRLVASGADLRTVMSITGHTQVNVLMRHYANVMDGKQKEALKMAFG